jgi:hypothetical protein
MGRSFALSGYGNQRRIMIYRRRNYQKNLRNGICVDCQKKPITLGTTRCRMCRKKQSQWAKNYRAFLKEYKICLRCKAPVQSGRIHCSKCLKRLCSRISQHRNKLKKNGFCPQCGKIPEEGRIYCNRCLEKSRLRRLRKK